MNWTLTLPTVPPSGNIVMRMHHMVYHRLLLAWFNRIRAGAGFLAIPKATGKRRITITRWSHHALDSDNLAFSMKAVFDALRPPLVQTGVYQSGERKGQPWRRSRIGHALIVEDDPVHVERIVKNGKLGKGDKPHTTIEIEDVEEA